MTYGSSLTQSNHKVNVNVTNYDSDGDGLIEIENLDQLNAIRYDLDGNGQPAAASIASYIAAFPARSESHGCPDTTADADTDPGPCLGYELVADLDFDTDENGSVSTGDDYPNWTPVGGLSAQYTANFNGNGHTITNLTINLTGQFPGTINYMGLFGYVNGGPVIENVGLIDVDMTDARTRSSYTLYRGGALAGFISGTVRTSYATGNLSATVAGNTGSLVGGLIGGLSSPGAIDTSYATVDITGSSTSTHATSDSVGGLVGRAYGSTAINASYARGSISGTRSGTVVGGLVGTNGATITASYWDTTTSAIADDADNNAPEGLATASLQTPTSYTGIYADWNGDVDGDATTGDADGKDDPWDFGTGTQYPVLKYANHAHHLVAQGRDPVDYDTDDDGLIEITTLAQLNAVRYDLDGNGTSTGYAYHLAFPNRDRSQAGRMGCDLTDHDSDSNTPNQATCTGYELMASLDFDTDGDGATYTTSAMGVVAVDADDTGNYFNGAAGWTPLGGHGADAVPYTATFEGNHHTISNLFINLDTAGDHTGKYVGLFADLGKPATTSPAAPAQPGAVRNLGLVNPYVKNERDGAHSTLINYVRTGAPGREQQRRRRRERQLGRRRFRNQPAERGGHGHRF